MSTNEINVDDYVQANRDIPGKLVSKGDIGQVTRVVNLQSDLYLDIKFKHSTVYMSGDHCWNKVDKPENIIEPDAEEPQPTSEEPATKTYKVPEPDWKEIEALAVEHADSGFGVAGSTELSYHSFTPDSLKEFVMSVLEHTFCKNEGQHQKHMNEVIEGWKESAELHIPQPTVFVRDVLSGECDGAGIQLHVGGGGGGGYPQDSGMGCAVGRGWSVGGVETNYGPGGGGPMAGIGATGGPIGHEVNRDHTFGPGVLDDDRNKD